MKIVTLPLAEDHWSSDWIPISYGKKFWTYGSGDVIDGKTFLWSESSHSGDPKGPRGSKVMALCRVFPITKNRVELGDLWLNPELRGKKNETGVKYSLVFLRKVIAKIWKLYTGMDRISLVVHRNNYVAIRLYERLAFHPTDSLNPTLKLKDTIMMERRRGRFRCLYGSYNRIHLP